MDRAIFVTLLRWGWNVGAGMVTIVVITIFLSPEIQGFYYTFNSLIALQIFAELGLNLAIIQFASHEMVELSWSQSGIITGSEQAKRRLQSLINFAFTWFGITALLMIIILLPLGLYFFGVVNARETTSVSITNAWIVLVVFTAINLIVSAALAILEGCGKIADVAMIRLLQAIFAMTIAWCILCAGGGVYALSVSSVIMALVGFAWIWKNYRKFFREIIMHKIQLPGLGWRTEIWPFQWRIAISFMSGYFFVQLFTPLVFKYHGPVAAGQMGMSLQIIGALNGAAMAWIVTKVPQYGNLIATHQRAELDTLFFKGVIQSLIFLLIAIGLVWLVIFWLNQFAESFATRVLPLPLFSLLCLVCIANHILYAEAAYLRAHKEEPFMVLSVLIALVTTLLALVMVPTLGVTGAVYSYATSMLLIGFVGGTSVFFYKRKLWMQKIEP